MIFILNKIKRSQPANDIPGTSPESPLKVLTFGTNKGPSGDSQGTITKIDDLMQKLFLRSNSSCITYLCLFFTERTNIQKISMGTSTGHLQYPVVGRPEDQMIGHSRDVSGTSVKQILNSTHKHVKITLTEQISLW